MDERDRTTSNRHLGQCEYEDLRHAYYRARAEMIQHWKRERATGKTPFWFLEDPEDWTPVAMDEAFWRMVMGGLDGLRRQLCHAEMLDDD